MYSDMGSIPVLSVAIIKLSAHTMSFMWGLCSSAICEAAAVAESPVDDNIPTQYSFPGKALPSQAYETTSNLPK